MNIKTKTARQVKTSQIHASQKLSLEYRKVDYKYAAVKTLDHLNKFKLIDNNQSAYVPIWILSRALHLLHLFPFRIFWGPWPRLMYAQWVNWKQCCIRTWYILPSHTPPTNTLSIVSIYLCHVHVDHLRIDPQVLWNCWLF